MTSHRSLSRYVKFTIVKTKNVGISLKKPTNSGNTFENIHIIGKIAYSI
ncbi:conserved hypothetical protein [Leptospira interrogans serovar Manilae]|uniref:Transposase n=1 Tax=Leptospira interrogans serovar Manilae TaxID=214675 RepID=A0AAQ1NX22_LEPIR|nr:conserved hypothetical protein [Leptospira interrogans serovar Manilae]